MRRCWSWVLLALVVVSALVAAGCGDDDDDGGRTSGAGATTTAAAGGGGNEIEGLEPGEPLKVGVLMTFSGPVAEAGHQQFRGLEAAIEDINADGGVAGHEIEVVRRDDGGDPNKAVSLARELVEQEKVKIVFGTTLSTPALAVMPYLTQQKVTLVGSMSADQVDDPSTFPYVFTGSPVTRTQVQAMVSTGQASFDAKKVGVLVEATAYGDSLLPQFRAQLEEAGLQGDAIVVQRYPQGAPTIEAQMSALRNAGVGVVYHGGIGADAVRIPRTAAQVGLDVPLVGNQGTNALIEQILLQLGGADKATNVYSIYFRKQTYTEGGRPAADLVAFQQRMSDAAGRDLASVSQEATFFDLGRIVADAIEEARTLEADPLRKAIEGTTFRGLLVDWDFTTDRHAGPTADDMVLSRSARFSNGGWERFER